MSGIRRGVDRGVDASLSIAQGAGQSDTGPGRGVVCE